jgi:hypothetical protein
MTKIKKQVAVFVAVIITVIGVMAIPISAAGSFNVSYNSSTRVIGYSFSVNSSGATSSIGFVTSSSTSHTASFSGISGTGANFKIYSESGTLMQTITIPQYVSGMPTLTTTVYLPAGRYYVKANSTSSTTANGSVTLNSIDGIW